MAVKLRLRREGTKKKPHYRVVAADARTPRDGRFIEIIGEYHPLREPSGVEIDGERALYWLRNGAQPTAAVEKLLRITGVWHEFRPGDGPPPQPVATQPADTQPAAAQPAADTPPAGRPAPPPPAEAADESAAGEAPEAEAAASGEAPDAEAAGEPAGEAPEAEAGAADAAGTKESGA